MTKCKPCLTLFFVFPTVVNILPGTLQDLGGLPTPSALPFSLEILSASPLSWSPLQQQQTAWLYLASAVPAVAIEPEPTLSGDTQG